MTLTTDTLAFVTVILGISPPGSAGERQKGVKIFVFYCLLWYIDLTVRRGQALSQNGVGSPVQGQP